MLESIRTYFFEKEKRKRAAASLQRKFQFKKGHSNHYGILLDAGQIDHRQIVLHFAEELRQQGNRVKILGYIEGRTDSIALPFDIFTSTEISKFTAVPKSIKAEEFMQQPFDVLINMSIYFNHKALEYICAASAASFKIGPWYHHLNRSPYDLCLDVGEAATLREWISELMHTLEKIY
jgi:hypothetical protein